jgi:hypothetical protein
MSRLKAVIFIFLIAAFVLQFLTIDLWDYDFWWHIATGKYIVSTVSLPEKDPFSYTSAMKENENLYSGRETFILKQYWLSQVIFYYLYDHTGPKGIIILRSMLYTMTLILVLWQLQRWFVSTPLSFIFVFNLFMVLITRMTGERPVLFTIFFTALTFFILEGFKYRKNKRIFFLLPLMLLWSNLHGGFIIGVVIITIYMFGEGLKIISKRVEYTRREITLLYAATSTALFFSFINPTGWDAFAIAISSEYKPFTANIQEYISPFIAYYKQRLYSPNYWLLALLALFPVILIIRRKRIDLTHLMLLPVFFIMSISAMRYEDYYGIIATMVLGRELDVWIKEFCNRRFSELFYSKLMRWLTAASLISVTLYMVGYPLSKSPRFAEASEVSVPKAAVNFIEKTKLKGNMFNDYGFGGYITWRLYPWKKTFIDSRALNLTVMSEYGWIMKTVDSLYGAEPSIKKGPLWERLLNHYDINFIILPLHDVLGTVSLLILKLSESDKWAPVYCDKLSVIFVRNTEQNKYVIERFRLPEEYVYNMIIYKSAINAMDNRVNPRSLMSLGNFFYNMGRLEDAVAAYRYAVKRLPDPLVQKRIDEIETEIKSKGKKDVNGKKIMD